MNTLIGSGAVLLELLIVVVLTAHLLCVNVASAGPLVCVWFEWREGRRNALAGRTGRALAVWALGLFVLGMVLGVVLGAIHWTPEYRESIERLWGKVYFGLWELVFSLVLMALHAVWWHKRPALPVSWRAGRMLLPLLASTNLLYHFPFLFIVLSDMRLQVDAEAGPIDAAAFRHLMAQPAVYTRAIHFNLAAFAVTGVAIIARSAFRLSRGEEEQRRAIAWGARLALVPTLLQIVVGFWMMTQLPPAALGRLMGGDLLGTALFGMSLLIAFAMMHRLASLSLGESDVRLAWQSVWMMILVVGLMTAVLQRVMPTRGPEIERSHHAPRDPSRIESPVASGSQAWITCGRGSAI